MHSADAISSSRKRPVYPSAEEQPRVRQRESPMLFRYIINGEAGEMEIGRHQSSISVEALHSNTRRDHLQPDDISKDNETK